MFKIILFDALDIIGWICLITACFYAALFTVPCLALKLV